MSDLTDVFTRMPALLGLGLSLQFTVMPLLGFALSRCGMLDHWDAAGTVRHLTIGSSFSNPVLCLPNNARFRFHSCVADQAYVLPLYIYVQLHWAGDASCHWHVRTCKLPWWNRLQHRGIHRQGKFRNRAMCLLSA